MGRFIEVLLIFVSWGVPWVYTVKYVLLKKRYEGLNRPELWLSRKQRRAHAQKELARKDEEYSEQHIDRIYRQLIDGPNQLKGDVNEK
jgi:hypothetical protein